MIIDAICAIVGLYGFWVGYSRGIISTILMVISLLFGAIAAAKLSPAMTELLTYLFSSSENSHGFMLLAGVVLTFIITLVLFRFLGRAIEEGLQSININFINQVIGGVVTAMLFILFYSVLVVFADRSRLIEDSTKEESGTFALLADYPGVAWDAGKQLWPVFQEFYDYALDVMDRIDDSVEKRESNSFFDLEEEPTDRDEEGLRR